MDTRQEAWMQDRKNTRKKTKGEMRRNLQLIACVRIIHFFPVSFGSIGSSSGFNERINESITETIMFL